jgi:hypothetical protein
MIAQQVNPLYGHNLKAPARTNPFTIERKKYIIPEPIDHAKKQCSGLSLVKNQYSQLTT